MVQAYPAERGDREHGLAGSPDGDGCSIDAQVAVTMLRGEERPPR